MSADIDTRKRGREVTAAVLKLDIRERFVRFAREHSPKQLAAVADISHRTAEKWRNGSLPSLPAFIAMAREIPELRAIAMQWIAAERDLDPDKDRLGNEIMRLVERYEEARGRKAFTAGGDGR